MGYSDSRSPCNAFLLIFYCHNYYSHGFLPMELLAKHIGALRNTSPSGLSNMAELAWSKKNFILPVHKPGAVWNGAWVQKIPSKGFKRGFAFGETPALMLGCHLSLTEGLCSLRGRSSSRFGSR